MTTLQRFKNKHYDFHLNHRTGKIGVVAHYNDVDELFNSQTFKIEAVGDEIIISLGGVRIYRSFDCPKDTFIFFILSE